MFLMIAYDVLSALSSWDSLARDSANCHMSSLLRDGAVIKQRSESWEPVCVRLRYDAAGKIISWYKTSAK